MFSEPQHIPMAGPEGRGRGMCMRDQAIASQGRQPTDAELASPFTALGQPLGVQTHQQTTGRWISALHAAAPSHL